MQNVKVTRKGHDGPVPPRLSILFAREAPVAVIFRRGPSKWVQVTKWNTADDTFEPGQWFHGKIYDKRSDLSPDGSLLLYFAQKITGKSLQDAEYTYAWTAISKPPYLTALALWPKGDCWHGGGHFLDAKTIELNHKSNVANAHPNHQPKGIRVELRNHVHGEDDPIFSERLERDGWKLKQEWLLEYRGPDEFYRTIQPELREKVSQDGDLTIRLTRSISCFDYSEVFLIAYHGDSHISRIPGASWVDLDQQGRLVIAKDGRIYIGDIQEGGTIDKRELLDLNSSEPTPLPSPQWAREW
jgi:hypothetical protein